MIERAQSAAAIGRVRQALLAEKTRDKDPRMPDDTIQICRDEVKRIQSAPDPLLTSIYIDHSNTFDFLLKKFVLLYTSSLLLCYPWRVSYLIFEQQQGPW